MNCRAITRFLIATILLLQPALAWAEKTWTHVEWGAANYAKSDETVDLGNAIKTIADLIQQHGVDSAGIFLLNDLQIEATDRAVRHLQKECKNRGWKNIEIRPLPGNYLTMEIPRTDSAHIKNPHRDILIAPDRLQAMADASATGLILDTFWDFSPDRTSSGNKVTFQTLGPGYPWGKMGVSSRFHIARSACAQGFSEY